MLHAHDARRARSSGENGLIAVDEHTSLPCLISERSERGARLVSFDVTEVPETFLLATGVLAEAWVCQTVWRTQEEIGVRFAARVTEADLPAALSLR